VTSLLTIVGVLIMMFLISPLLAVIALVTVRPRLSSHPDRQALAAELRPAMEDHRELNGHIEEMYTGHALVQVFGHTRSGRNLCRA